MVFKELEGENFYANSKPHCSTDHYKSLFFSLPSHSLPLLLSLSLSGEDWSSLLNKTDSPFDIGVQSFNRLFSLLLLAGGNRAQGKQRRGLWN